MESIVHLLPAFSLSEEREELPLLPLALLEEEERLSGCLWGETLLRLEEELFAGRLLSRLKSRFDSRFDSADVGLLLAGRRLTLLSRLPPFLSGVISLFGFLLPDGAAGRLFAPGRAGALCGRTEEFGRKCTDPKSERRYEWNVRPSFTRCGVA